MKCYPTSSRPRMTSSLKSMKEYEIELDKIESDVIMAMSSIVYVY